MVMSMARNKRWIQHAVKREGRVRTYVKRLFGDKAFKKNGSIKYEYLVKAMHEAKKNKNTSLVRAINLAITLRRFK